MDKEPDDLVQLVPELRDKSVTVVPLTGGITNRNYRLDAVDQSYVLRIGGEGTHLLGIDRVREYECSLQAARLGVGPEVVAFLPERDALVTRFASGRVLTPDDMRHKPILRRVVDALSRCHRGPSIPGAFSPFTTVRDYYALAREREVPFPSTITRAMDLLAQMEEAAGTAEAPCPCHNDLLPANFIDDGRSVWIIDWEYAGMGDPFFDLGNLAVNNRFADSHERLLLELYFGEVRPEHRRRLRMMRLVSDMREAMWGFLQAGISTLDSDFLRYGQIHLERFLAAATVLEPDLLKTT
ncbi:MAG: phosphotransferase [Chloroflexota bacterium]